MENFDRVGPSPFRPDGRTKDTDIEFAGGSRLQVYGGSPSYNFRLKFSNMHNTGWVVGPASLDQLIAELLYIRRDMQKFSDGIDFDIEVGRTAADAFTDPEDENEEEEPGMGFGDMG